MARRYLPSLFEEAEESMIGFGEDGLMSELSRNIEELQRREIGENPTWKQKVDWIAKFNADLNALPKTDFTGYDDIVVKMTKAIIAQMDNDIFAVLAPLDARRDPA